jgi:hypothetical protein
MTVRHIISFLPIIISSCIGSNDWYLLKSKDFGFEIEFPKEPKFTKQTSIFEYGKQDFNIFLVELGNDKDDNITYFACKTIYPDSLINTYKTNIDDFFNSSIQRSIESVHGKKILDKVISYKDSPGREVKIDFKNGEAVMTMRIYLINNSAYILETITRTEKDYNKSQTKFFDSFKLIEK